jgi:hypothetical protein
VRHAAAARGRRRVGLTALAIACGVGFATVAAGCETASRNDAITPRSGIIVRADSLTAGLGCGTGDGQVYRYSVIVTRAPDTERRAPDGAPSPEVGRQTVAVGTYDCFADAVIRVGSGGDNLLQTDLDLEIRAWNKAAFEQQDVASAVAASASFAEVPADAARPLLRLAPTWTSLCTARQESLVEVLANCTPLARSDAQGTLSIPVAPFALESGREMTCGFDYGHVRVFGPGRLRLATQDAGPPSDAGDRDASDASDASPLDASSDADAAQPGPGEDEGGADASSDAGSGRLPLAERSCREEPVLVQVPTGVDLAYELELLVPFGREPLYRVLCRGRASPGIVQNATCGPALPL